MTTWLTNFRTWYATDDGNVLPTAGLSRTATSGNPARKRLKMAKVAEDSPELVFATLMMPHLELDLYVSKGGVPVPTDAISGGEGEAQTYDNHHDHYNWPYVRQ